MSPKITYTKSEWEILKGKNDEVKSISEIFTMFSANQKVWFIERPFLPKVKVLLHEKSITVYSNGCTNEEIEKAINIINKNGFYKNFHNLHDDFMNVSCILFGFIDDSNDSIYIDDIYVNDNWVCFDDVLEITEKHNIQHPNVLFHDRLTLSTTEVFNSMESEFYEDKTIRSFIVRPEVEVDRPSNGRVCGLAVNPAFKKKTKKEVKSKNENDKDASSAADFLLDYYFDEQLFAFLVQGLSENGIPINKNNKDKILSFITKTFLSKFDKDIDEFSKTEKVNKENIIFNLKKSLPKRFLKTAMI